MLKADGAEHNKELVANSATVPKKRANNALHAFDALFVERRTGVRI